MGMFLANNQKRREKEALAKKKSLEMLENEQMPEQVSAEEQNNDTPKRGRPRKENTDE